ncbi:hypothetical protein JCM10207_007222 [Rhodosporidiobolus poonsookiae]
MYLFTLLLPLVLAALVAATPSPLPLPSASDSLIPRDPSWSGMKRALAGSEQLTRRGEKGGGTDEGLLEARKERAPGELRMKKAVKRQHCYYVGTFFHLIDCNAGVNSTSIPFAPEPASTGAAKRG